MTGLVPVWAVTVVLLAALVAANLPFVNERLFLVGPRRPVKAVAWRLLELLVYALLVALLAIVADQLFDWLAHRLSPHVLARR